MCSDRARSNVSPSGDGSGRPPLSLKALAAEEGRKFFVLFLYLWVLFGVFVLNQDIVLREQGVNVTAQGVAVVNALVLAKVMLLFEHFDPGRWLRRRPLIYPILFEALLLTIVFLIVHVLEKAIGGVFHGKTIADSLPSIGGGGLAGLLSVAVIMFVALVPFFAFRNLSLVLGEDRVRSLLFSAKPDAREAQPR
jgi:hypothetical protein